MHIPFDLWKEIATYLGVGFATLRACSRELHRLDAWPQFGQVRWLESRNLAVAGLMRFYQQYPELFVNIGDWQIVPVLNEICARGQDDLLSATLELFRLDTPRMKHFYPDLARIAAQNGRVEILRRLRTYWRHCWCSTCNNLSPRGATHCAQEAACSAGQFDTAVYLEKTGAPVNLNAACRGGNLDLVCHALTASAVRSWGNAELADASRSGSLRLVRFLARRFRLTRDEALKIGLRSFQLACELHHCDIALWLAERFELTRDELRLNRDVAFHAACTAAHPGLACWVAEHAVLPSWLVIDCQRKAIAADEFEFARKLAAFVF